MGGIMARILIIDDDQDSRILIKFMLQQRGHETTEAENGLVALNLLKTDSFDLVISDIRMPHMDGLDLLNHIRRIFPSMPVIFISAQNPHASAPKTVDGNLDRYLQKPFTHKQLVEEVNKVFACA
jgi:CheY-like chemotaxis protein